MSETSTTTQSSDLLLERMKTATNILTDALAAGVPTPGMVYVDGGEFGNTLSLSARTIDEVHAWATFLGVPVETHTARGGNIHHRADRRTDDNQVVTVSHVERHILAVAS